MYHLYQTPAFILGGTNVSEGSKLISFLTRDLGLVRAHARSVREERSKLRGYLQPFTFVEVALIRGRDLWRVTTAGPLGGELRRESRSIQLRALARYSKLIERVIQGEEQNKELFNECESAVLFLSVLEESETVTWEVLSVARILDMEGYLNLSQLEEMKTASWGFQLFHLAKKEEGKLIRMVNEALLASQL